MKGDELYDSVQEYVDREMMSDERKLELELAADHAANTKRIADSLEEIRQYGIGQMTP